MRLVETRIPDVKVIELEAFPDRRGTFVRYWNRARWLAAGLGPFVEDNVSTSHSGVLRGLHVQTVRPQGKLLSVLQGAIYDVAVDLRDGSPTFGHWVGVSLEAGDGRQLWVPPGFAHGFAVTGGPATVHYRCTTVYEPEHQAGIRWDDRTLGIDWPLVAPVVSERDAGLPMFSDCLTIRSS